MGLETGHGRIDDRQLRHLEVKAEEIGIPHAAQLIELTRQSTKKKSGVSGEGRRIFMATQIFSPADAARVPRDRWGIENKNHHPRDATLLEDENRCRTGNTAANLTLLRGFVLGWWRLSEPAMPAPAFLAKNKRGLDRALHQLIRPISHG